MGTTLNFISSVQFRSMIIPLLVDEKTKRMSPIGLILLGGQFEVVKQEKDIKHGRVILFIKIANCFKITT